MLLSSKCGLSDLVSVQSDYALVPSGSFYGAATVRASAFQQETIDVIRLIAAFRRLFSDAICRGTALLN